MESVGPCSGVGLVGNINVGHPFCQHLSCTTVIPNWIYRGVGSNPEPMILCASSMVAQPLIVERGSQ